VPGVLGGVPGVAGGVPGMPGGVPGVPVIRLVVIFASSLLLEQ